jgi:serine/threonine protein kinase
VVSSTRSNDPSDPLIGKMLKSPSGAEYEVVSPISSGSNGLAYMARSKDNKEVAIKRLELRGINSWKQLELFEREAKVLASLSHPSIPKYVDDFESDDGFFLVQDLVKGIDLAAMIDKGLRANDAQATRIAIELINICCYLSSLHPPVVHRDIKPANIILEAGNWDGKVYLIDFGGVLSTSQETEQSTLTFVGTFGYLSPEQFRNQAVPSSDLYSVGATLLFLLSGRDPSSIAQERMRLKWRDVLSLDRSDTKWPRILDGLLEPLVEDRMSASDALAILEGKEVPKTTLSSFGRTRKMKKLEDQMWRRGLMAPGSTSKPQGTRVTLDRSTARCDSLTLYMLGEGMNLCSNMPEALALFSALLIFGDSSSLALFLPSFQARRDDTTKGVGS